jgi:hypothetical protein
VNLSKVSAANRTGKWRAAVQKDHLGDKPKVPLEQAQLKRKQVVKSDGGESPGSGGPPLL